MERGTWLLAGSAAVAIAIAAASLRRRSKAFRTALTKNADAVRARVGEAEWALRVNLAFAYRLAAKRRWDEVIYNHITLRVPGAESGSTRFLVNQFGLRFDEVTASNLLTLDATGKVVDGGSNDVPRVNLAGFVIHGALHEARPDMACIWHCHYSPVTAMASIKAGMLPVSQEACIILPRVSSSTHPFEGVATDLDEQKRLVRSFGPKAQVLLMENHGVLCGGPSVAVAFYNTHLITRAADHQMEAMRAVGGRVEELVLPSEAVVEQTTSRLRAQFDAASQEWGVLEWDAVKRGMDGVDADDSSGGPLLRRLPFNFGGGLISTEPEARRPHPPLKPVRLLALHGYPGTFGCAAGVDALDALKVAMAKRGYALEIVAPRAPNPTDATGNPPVRDGIAWIAGDQSAAGKVVGFGQRDLSPDAPLEPPYSEADLPPLTDADNVWAGSSGFEASLKLLLHEWRTAATPFDGVLGFSQGALTAAILTSYLHRGGPAGGPKWPPPPRFAILCGGFRRPWPKEAADVWPPKAPLPTPSLHVIGARDTVVAPCRSDELLGAFAQPAVHRHELVGAPPSHGGHVVPWDAPFYAAVAALLERAM